MGKSRGFVGVMRRSNPRQSSADLTRFLPSQYVASADTALPVCSLSGTLRTYVRSARAHGNNRDADPALPEFHQHA